MRRAIFLIVLLCVFLSGCTLGGENVKIANATVEKAPGKANAYSGRVVGVVSGDARYRMCAVLIRSGQTEVGKFDKTKSIGPGDTVTLNVDGALAGKPTALVLCCYESESYTSSHSCSNEYKLSV